MGCYNETLRYPALLLGNQNSGIVDLKWNSGTQRLWGLSWDLGHQGHQGHQGLRSAGIPEGSLDLGELKTPALCPYTQYVWKS